jgi:hypothetical protein
VITTKPVPRGKRATLLLAALLGLLTAVGLVTVGAKPARADASAPSWWRDANGSNTVCDTAHYSGSFALGASYNGVKACGPGPTQGGTDHEVHFYTGAWGEYEWECVELVMRYMYQVYGIAPYSVTGGHAYNVVNDYGGSVLTKVTNNGASLPAPGDILAFAASTNHPTDGHTAVVTSVNVDGNGNGTVTYMQQNAGYDSLGVVDDGWGSVSVTSNVLGDNITKWLHNPSAGGAAQGSGVSIGYSPISGLPTIAAQGPNHSLYVYWQTSDTLWHGPLGVGAGGSTYSAPSIAFSPSGLPTVVAQGPNNSLYSYWETSDGSWHGPIGVGGGSSTYSAPSIAFSTNGLPGVVAQGPNNGLYLYWETSDGSWHGPLSVGGAGSTYSAPAIADSPTNGLATVVAQGPNNSLYTYWQTADGNFHGPIGVGGGSSTYSAPSIAFSTNGLPTAVTQGPNNSLYSYWETADGSWHGPLGVGAGGSTY